MLATAVVADDCWIDEDFIPEKTGFLSPLYTFLPSPSLPSKLILGLPRQKQIHVIVLVEMLRRNGRKPNDGISSTRLYS